MAEHRITLIEPMAVQANPLVRRLLRLSARDALLISNIAFLTLAALTLVASMVVFSLYLAHEREKDRELAAHDAAAAVRIHSASADAAAALERAVARDSENLLTRERTAMLDREAAASRAQAPPTTAQAAPISPRTAQPFAERTMSSEQRAKFIAELIQYPGQVMVLTGAGAETERYADALKVLFSVSGWVVESGVAVGPRASAAPVSVVLGSSSQDIAIRRAFEAAGVAASDRPRAPTDRPCTIYIGA